MNESQGYYRRRIILDAHGDVVVAAVEDDFHHFQIFLSHDRRKITQLNAHAIRVPWTTCPDAANKLKELIGLELCTDLVSLDKQHDRFLHCTHLIELALMAAVQAVRGGRRQYDITIPDPHSHGQAPASSSCLNDVAHVSGTERTVQLMRDGIIVLDWKLDGDIITSPSALTGYRVRDLGLWAANNCGHEAFEAIKIMRRCLQVSTGRMATINPEVASEIPGKIGACYAFHTARVRMSHRSTDKAIDFTNRPSDLLITLL